jgi:biotin transporter BioY
MSNGYKSYKTFWARNNVINLMYFFLINSVIILFCGIIVYYVMRSKNKVLCAAAGRLAAERSEADKPAKAHKTIFAPNNR